MTASLQRTDRVTEVSCRGASILTLKSRYHALGVGRTGRPRRWATRSFHFICDSGYHDTSRSKWTTLRIFLHRRLFCTAITPKTVLPRLPVDDLIRTLPATFLAVVRRPWRPSKSAECAQSCPGADPRCHDSASVVAIDTISPAGRSTMETRFVPH